MASFFGGNRLVGRNSYAVTPDHESLPAVLSPFKALTVVGVCTDCHSYTVVGLRRDVFVSCKSRTVSDIPSNAGTAKI